MAAPLQLGDNPWQATAIAYGDGDPIPVVEGTRPHIRFEDDRVSGDAGCNRFFGPCDATGTAIRLGEMATTLMACLDAVMDQEQAFLEALESADSYAIAGSTLEMRSGNSVVLLFEAVPTTLSDASWHLTGLNSGRESVASVVADTQVTATFNEDGTLAGSSGCNTYRATWTTDTDRIEIGPPIGVKKTCDREGVMEQEARYLELLGVVTTYQIDASTLELLDDEGVRQLVFARAEE
ncbi:MAG: hypothetical protein BMS9Abin07_0408 [Acidimicrobiia bacterium]|nr:MAG: hypothetical protein BMS9Abin07_0408 [Acidimicrobiia bacterium]